MKKSKFSEEQIAYALREVESGRQPPPIGTIETKPTFHFSNETVNPVNGFDVAFLSRDYDITSDGKRLLMVFLGARTTNGDGLINVVLNGTEELKKVGAHASQ
jgi:hypothetical protein